MDGNGVYQEFMSMPIAVPSSFIMSQSENAAMYLSGAFSRSAPRICAATSGRTQTHAFSSRRSSIARLRMLVGFAPRI